MLYTLAAEGMPILYYGIEQGFQGGQSYDENREPLWRSGYATDGAEEGVTYGFVASVNTLRHRVPRESFAAAVQVELFIDVHVPTRMDLWACNCAHAPVRMHLCTCTCAHAYRHTCIHAYMHRCTCTYTGRTIRRCSCVRLPARVRCRRAHQRRQL